MSRQIQTIYDELLILRCQTGETHALQLIVKRWQLPLSKFAQVVCNNPDLASEAVQETWLSVVHGIDKLNDVSRFQQWLFQILNRKCIDQLRRRLPVEAVTEAIDSHDPRLQMEREDEIHHCLTMLSDAHRTVLALHYLQEMEIEEIAVIVRVPEGTVKSRLFHARNEFKKVLDTRALRTNQKVI